MIQLKETTVSKGYIKGTQYAQSHSGRTGYVGTVSPYSGRSTVHMGTNLAYDELEWRNKEFRFPYEDY